MRRLLLRIGLLAAFLASCSTPIAPMPTAAGTAAPLPSMTPTPPPFRIIAYATDGIIESLIPYDRLTHVNYSSLTPKSDGTFNPIVNGWNLKKIVQNGHANNVQVLISVGGWGWDKQFEEMAAGPKSRAAFVRNLKAFIEEYQLDGVDIDWEYPDPDPSSENFLALMLELRAALPDKLLTTAVVAYGDTYGLGVPTETFELFDFLNIMTYAGQDHGTLEQYDKGLDYWSGRGLPKEKNVIGVPFYSEPNGISFAKLTKQEPAAAQVDEFEYAGAMQRYNGIPTIQAKTRTAMERTGGIMYWGAPNFLVKALRNPLCDS